uniref:Uncharacterized protein n=1 Tax=Rhizophora mucronata TaxID=61149 RepID=A0A2P2NFA5_RHIMU
MGRIFRPKLLSWQSWQVCRRWEQLHHKVWNHCFKVFKTVLAI